MGEVLDVQCHCEISSKSEEGKTCHVPILTQPVTQIARVLSFTILFHTLFFMEANPRINPGRLFYNSTVELFLTTIFGLRTVSKVKADSC